MKTRLEGKTRNSPLVGDVSEDEKRSRIKGGVLTDASRNTSSRSAGSLREISEVIDLAS